MDAAVRYSLTQIFLTAAYVIKMKYKQTNVYMFVLVVVAAFSLCSGMLLEAPVPLEIQECMQTHADSGNSSSKMTFKTPEDMHVHCLNKFMWQQDHIRWSDFNVTEADFDYIRSLSKSLYNTHGRVKRQAGGGFFPPTGFRIRRELRRIPDFERMEYFDAVNFLKRIGRYDTFANLHRGIVVTSAHNGPNFLGWHRVYLSLYEEALRRYNRRVSLPYWDSSMDFDMENPVNSIIWSASFLGNGDGFVTTGPFANWETPVGRLARNIGGMSSLMRKEDIRRILTRCRNIEITLPLEDPATDIDFNLEIFHGGPHNWVGGQMMGLNTAAHDPVFFMHHAFIDYIWELFRIRQARFCGIDPTRDYPDSDGLHAAERMMDGLPPYRNIDGLSGAWTRFWYNYERAPTCSRFSPWCGSPYLRCHFARGVCVSAARRVAPGGPEASGMAFSAVATANSDSAMRAASISNSLPVGPRFMGPPSEPRTQEGQRLMRAQGMVRRRRAVPQQPEFRAPPSDGRTSDVMGKNIAKGLPGVDTFYGHQNTYGQNPFAYSASILPNPNYQDSTKGGHMPLIQNDFSINGHVNLHEWVFIPIRVVHRHVLDGSTVQNLPERYTSAYGCVQNDAGGLQVKTQTNGLNYAGTFTDYSQINAKIPVDSAIAVAAVKSPLNGTTNAIIMGVYGCGQICQPYCLTQGLSTQPNYKPCSGVVHVTSDDSTAYMKTYNQAMEQGKQYMAGRSGQFRIVLHCSLSDTSPWLFHSNRGATVA